jgi:hypothetical protein
MKKKLVFLSLMIFRILGGRYNGLGAGQSDHGCTGQRFRAGLWIVRCQL